MSIRVIHIIAPYEGSSSSNLFQRQDLCLESIDLAERDNTFLIAATCANWKREGWEIQRLQRDARSLGDTKPKPFLIDLYNIALTHARPDDWLLYSNTDCAISKDLYQTLSKTQGTIVEYMRQDVGGEPKTLEELLNNNREVFFLGIDGLALRAQFYKELRPYLPDFVIGEPHWDTLYSAFLRSVLPVRRETKRLFHPKHEQMWSVYSPSPAGKHNCKLYDDAIIYGNLDDTTIKEEPNKTDTAIILANFGNDPVRIAASTKAIREQWKQDLFVDFYLVELLIDDQKSLYPPEILSQLCYIPVKGDDANKDLFQKEPLMNLGWRTALEKGNYDYFIFLDSDLYSERTDWFRKIRSRLREHPSRIVQGFRIVEDTVDDQFRFSSLGAPYVLNYQTDLPLNPGICWGVHRSLLKMGNGFNPYGIDGAGDSIFVTEYLNSTEIQYDISLCPFHWYREIERDLPFRAQFDCVSIDLLHEHHGYLKQRNRHDFVRYAIDGFPPFKELVELDAKGLLRWKSPGCPEREIFRQRATIQSRNHADRLFEDYKYKKYVRKTELKKKEWIPKPIFQNDVPSLAAFPQVKITPQKSKIVEIACQNIFNPEQVFRDEFPLSWCKGIANKKGSLHIPIVPDKAPPTLFLKRKIGGDPVYRRATGTAKLGAP